MTGVECRASSALFGFVFCGSFGALVAPRIRLWAGHDAGNVGIFAFSTISTSPASGARFRSPRRLFFLLFCASPLSLALAPRQWIPSSHLALL
jgi:hypothetical protein